MPTALPDYLSNELEYIGLDGKNVYTTYDLGCSAALVTVGFVLVSLDKTNQRRVQFIFQREIGIEKTVHEYWVGHLEIKARVYFDNMKMLKNRIYGE